MSAASRTKVYRNSKADLHNQKLNNNNVARAAKWAQENSKSVASIHSTPRSASQPSSSTNLTKPRFRARSGGDEYKNDPIRNEDYNENLKLEPKQFIDDLQNCEFEDKKTSEDDKDSRSIHHIRSSTSGIPLRIRSTTQNQTANSVAKRVVPGSPSRVVKQHSAVISASPTRPEVKSTDVKSLTARRALETQYQNKKKKMDVLKKEILDKQKPLFEIYQTLVQMKRKLESNGKSKFPLEEIKIVNIKEIIDEQNKPPVENETEEKVQIDPVQIQEMKEAIKQVPLPLLELCKNMMTKRLALVNVLQKMSTGPIKYGELHLNVKALKDESVSLQKTLDETFTDQEKLLTEVADKWETLLHSNLTLPGLPDPIEIEKLQTKLKNKEDKLHHVLAEMEELRKKSQEINENREVASSMLKDKIRSLENDQNQDKTTLQEQKEKNSMLEQKLKVLKSRTKESETKQKEMEVKLNDLHKQYKANMEQLKTNDQRWIKEKEDLISKQKHDKQLLDKLTKDRAYFETRVKTTEELSAEWEAKYHAGLKTERNEIDEVRKTMLAERVLKETAENKYQALKQKLIEMEVQNTQVVDLVNAKRPFTPTDSECISSEREAELYTELMATRVALKSAEEQIQNYNREKLRFIDSIQCLQGDEEHSQDFIAKTLIKNVEKMSELEAKLAQSEEVISNQKIEIANLKVDAEHLKQYTAISLPEIENEMPQKDTDLKMMLHEGRIKLEQSLKKSLEYEHKIIRYENVLSKQGKQICEMENLLKVRDGLISMMKVKKDEVQMENDSLNKYANEIRDLLLQAKEEARNRSELVHELTTNLSLRDQICQKLEKKVKDLQGSLIVTNEKRYKLQDTLGTMEKELQTTKAHINKLAPELETRYGFDMSNFNNNCDENQQVVDEHDTPNQIVAKPIEQTFGDNSLTPFLKETPSYAEAPREHQRTKSITYTSLDDIEKAINNLSSALEPISNCILSETKTCNSSPLGLESAPNFGTVKDKKKKSQITKLNEIIGDAPNKKMENNALVSNKNHISIKSSGSSTKIPIKKIRVNSKVNLLDKVPSDQYFERMRNFERNRCEQAFRSPTKMNAMPMPMRGRQPEKPKSPSILSKPPISPRFKQTIGNSQLPYSAGFERVEFINHARNISRHLNDRQQRQYAEIYNIKNKKTKPHLTSTPTEMEVKNRELITRSLSQIKSDLVKSIKLLSENILKSDELKTAGSLPYL